MRTLRTTRWSPGWTAGRLDGASIVITNKAPITAATLERLPSLRLVAVAPTGADCVDKAACSARGVAVVRSDAGLVSGAGFDVADGEPPSPDNPLMRAASRHNVILTPHVAWASDEAQQALADQRMDNIENFIAGRPTNLVQGDY
jgi:glycerate dehydrogenase